MNEVRYPNIGERYYEERLPNGLLVRVVPKRGFARKYAFLAVDFGAIDTAFSVKGQPRRVPDGIAHYLEHKMFDLPEENAMRLFAAYGGNPNAFTGYAMTAYYFSCTEAFEKNLQLLLHMLETPYFTPESVEKERGIIAQEIRMYEDSAESRVYEDMFRAMFRRHPIRVPIAGSVESIAEITSEMLYACHRAFYSPKNMMLCVVGDVEAERVFALAGALASGEDVPLRDYGAEEPMPDVPSYTEREMAVSMPMFSLGFRCAPPERGFETMRQEIIGDLAAELLIGDSSPLYLRLYEDGLIDSGFSCGYESVKNACLLSAGGDSRDPQAVLSALLEEARRLESGDFERFEQLKKSAIGRRTRDLDSFESICYRMCAYEFDGVDYFRFPEAYAAVTPEDVRNFLTQTVRPERAVLSVVRPKEESK